MTIHFVSYTPLGSPTSEPITCSNKQSIEPPFGQLASVPAVMKFFFCAHTRLLSKELCQVTSPKRGGFGPMSFGFTTGLRKWVIICTASPKIFVKRVASGRALLTVQDTPPVCLVSQTYPCVPTPRPNRNAEVPTGGVMVSGVVGLEIELLNLLSSLLSRPLSWA